jgi:hypothetical protein
MQSVAQHQIQVEAMVQKIVETVVLVAVILREQMETAVQE